MLRAVVRSMDSPLPLWIKPCRVGVTDASLAGVVDFGEVVFQKPGGYMVELYLPGSQGLLAQRPFGVEQGVDLERLSR